MANPRTQLDVLFIEDSEADTLLVVRQLQRDGFVPNWERVQTPEALRAALERRDWQLVISDSSIPQLDALRALSVTREVKPGTPFIVVSGTIAEETAVKALRSGAADYVTKDHLERLAPAVVRELDLAHAATSPGLSHRMLLAQEQERRRVARTLHDQLGAQLTATSLALRAAQAAQRDEQSEKLAEARVLLDHAIEQVRDVSVELWPSVLDDLGLSEGLTWVAERHARRSKIRFDDRIEQVPRLPTAMEVAYFRIAQEAIVNIERHAEASSVLVELRREDHTLVLVVRDDGKGFDATAAWQRAAAGHSLGLLSMRERAALAGAQFELTSSPGHGTTIEVRHRWPEETE